MADRFAGVWELVSFEVEAADGTVTRPWGDDPFGTITFWPGTDQVTAFLGPRDRSLAPVVSYFGHVTADPGAEGRLVTRVLGASAARLLKDQVRSFRLEGEDILVLSPPPPPGQGVARLRWRRVVWPA